MDIRVGSQVGAWTIYMGLLLHNIALHLEREQLQFGGNTHPPECTSQKVNRASKPQLEATPPSKSEGRGRNRKDCE